MKTSRLTPLLAIPCAVALVIVTPPSVASASDVTLTLTDAAADGVERQFVTAGSQFTYTLIVVNDGQDATALDVSVEEAVPDQVSQVTWTAQYYGGAVGPVVGAGFPSLSINLPREGGASILITVTVDPGADGEIVTLARATDGTQTLTATDTTSVTPAYFTSSSSGEDVEGSGRQLRAAPQVGPRVQLIDPSTSAVQAEFLAYEPGFRGGVQTSLGDLDGDGATEVVVAPGPGRVGEVRVFRVDSDGAGDVAVSRDSNLDLRPFGSRYRGGIAITAGDFDGDGMADLAVAKASGKSKVKVYLSRSVGSQHFVLERSFSPRPITGPSRITLASGDFGTFGRGADDPMLPDGRDELVIAGATRSGGQVQIRDTSRSAVPVLGAIRIAKVSREGLHVSVARVSKDGIPDLIIAQRRGKTVRVVVRDGVVGDEPNAKLLSFTTGRHRTGAPAFAAGVDSDGDGRADAIHVAWVGRNGSKKSVLPVIDQSTRSMTAGDADVSPTDVHGPIGMVAAGSAPGMVTTPSGLQYRDITVGTGATPSGAAPSVTIDFTIWLREGTLVDSENGVQLDLARTIPGLSEGIATMRMGGRRQLIIPANLAYGEAGTGNIPPNSTLTVDVTLLATT